MDERTYVYLRRRMSFCSSHRLHNSGKSDDQNRHIFGLCNNPNGHGHNYVMWVTLRGQPDEDGMVMNLCDLDKIIHSELVQYLDHKHLNMDVDFLAGINPTLENLVVVFWKKLVPRLSGKLHEIFLEETDNNSVIYRGPVAKSGDH